MKLNKFLSSLALTTSIVAFGASAVEPETTTIAKSKALVV